MNEITPDHPDEVRRLVADALEEARDGSLDDEQLEKVRQLLLTSPEARRAYLEFNDLSHLLESAQEEAGFPRATGDVSPPTATDSEVSVSGRRSRRLGWLAFGLTAAAVVFVMVFRGPRVEPPTERPAFATLVSSKGGTWVSSSQPSRVGTRLGAGRMAISSGLVAIDFDHGVEVVLEGPAEFELIEPDRCRLHSGMIVATAREGGEGFVVETPDGTVVDRGTSFGVTAGANGTDVVVFSGRVDVRDAADRGSRSITAGQQVRVTEDGLGEVRDDGEPDGEFAPEDEARVVRITTMEGRGRDGWVQFGEVEPGKRFPEGVLLANRTLPTYGRWQRMAVVTFDLSTVDLDRVESAALLLQPSNTHMGYASRIDDAKFTALGVTDESLDDWNAESHRWKNGPWRKKGRFDLERTTPVGDFVIPQGTYETIVIEGPELLDFLKRDQNGLATLTVHRNTRPNSLHALVHGFAGSRHPTLRPPTLRLTLKPNE